MKSKRIFSSALLSLLALLAALPVTAANIASGTSGTCSWVISKDSILTVKPKSGSSGELQTYTSVSKVPWYSYNTSIKKVVVKSGVKATSKINWLFLFCYLPNCIEMDLANLDVSEVTVLRCIVHNSPLLTEIKGLQNWDVSNVIYMDGIFQGCSSLKELKDIKNWNVTKVTSIRTAFQGCSSLTSLDLSGWDVSIITSLSSVFEGCSSLPSLDLSNWNVSNITYLGKAFKGCSSLTSLDFSNWNMSKVTNMSNTFQGCSSLTSLDLSGWDISKLAQCKETFTDCNVLGAGTDALTTPKIVGDSVPELPYTMYDWDNDNAAYTMLPAGELKLHKEMARTLSDIVDGTGTTDPVGVLGGLYVAAATEADEMLWCTDGAGNWTRAQVSDTTFATFASAKKLANVGGTMTNVTTNPLLTITSTPTAVADAEFSDYNTFTLAEDFSGVQPTEVAYFTGYYTTINGSPALQDAEKQSGRYIILDPKYVGTIELTEGKCYNILCGVLINEAWSGAPRRISSSDPTYYTNFTAYPLAIPEEVTAIEDITSDTTPHIVKYINPAGLESDTPFDGVNLIRYSNGIIKKVLH